MVAKCQSFLMLTLLIFAFLLIKIESLKIQEVEHHEEKTLNKNQENWTVLEWTWYETEYLLDDAPEIPKDFSVSKKEWKERYGQFFHTPEWLTEQKFKFCDWNGDLKIEANEVKCF